MLAGYNPILQALLGTLFTWGVTALGAALVFVFSSTQRKILDGSLGFAAGVMTAASYWSLLAPAIEIAETSGNYGDKGQYAFIPVGFGFFLGAVFVFGADQLMTRMGVTSPTVALAMHGDSELKLDKYEYSELNYAQQQDSTVIGVSDTEMNHNNSFTKLHRRKVPDDRLQTNIPPEYYTPSDNRINSEEPQQKASWRRILLLIIAITVHNIPEGLAVGVGFAAVNKTSSASFEKARNLALGIGIQNFPEGLAVSLPLRGSGYSAWKSFWYGQLSGMVEPIAGLLGAMAVSLAEPLLPYALSFAAGAMIYVVVDDIIPEAQICGNGKLATWATIFGFLVMMSLDVGLG